MSREIAKLLAPLARRLRLMASRCVLTLISDVPGIQIVQVKMLDGEIRAGIERMQQYGFTSVPLPGAEGVYLSLGGDRDHGIVIAEDDRRYRIKSLESGEIALYTWKDQEPHAHRIIFRNDGSIEVKGKNITVKASETARIEGDVVELHAASLFQFDCNGHGQKWYPTKIDTWQIGETAGASHAIAPPEIP